MKQKRKVKNLFSEKSRIRSSFLSHLLIILSCLLCVGAVSLFSLYVSAAEPRPVKFNGLDDNLEVVYGMSFSAENNLSHRLNEIYMSGNSLYMTQNSVIVNNGNSNMENPLFSMSNNVATGVYGNVLGGIENILESDNVTIIAGQRNTVNTGNVNATVIGGKGNQVTTGNDLTRPIILVGGRENIVGDVEGVNTLIGGEGNEVSNYANSSTILGGKSNKVYGKNVILGGSRINIRGSIDKVFVFSDGYDDFTPTTTGTFYLNVSGGLGINTEANTGSVGTKGSVMIGEIDIDSDTILCQSDAFGVQGVWSGCLVGCTQKANQEGGNGRMWELLTYTQKCMDQCKENPHCIGESLSGDEIVNPSFCTTGMFYTGNATMCNSNALQGYINVIFETNIIDSSVDCPTDGDNKCVFRCNEGAHLTGDQTGKGFGTGCYRDCQLPWSTDVIRHNQMITGYNMEDVYCSNDDGVHDDCLSHAGKMMCVDGTLYLVDESNHPTDYTAEGENFTIGVCNLNQYQCNVGEGGYNLVGTWIIGPGRDDIVLTTEDRSTVYGVRGIYHKCIDYSPKVPDDGTCQEDDSHYQLIQCQPGYATGTSYPYECRKKCTFEGVNIYKDGEAITGYKASLVTCPNVCEGINLVCNDGVWNGDATTYNHLNCVLNNAVCSTDTYPVSQSIKDNYGAHSVYSTACTPYRADGNLMCEALENRYTLINCDTNYHTEPGHESWNLYCISNSKQLPCTPGTGELKVYNTGYLVTYTWDGGWNAGSWTAPSNVECPWTCVPDYEPEGDECVPSIQPDPSLKVTKQTISSPANGEYYTLGEEIKYKITVENDGNLTITDVKVRDELTNLNETIDSLVAGASRNFTTSYIVREQDILSGSVKNEATADGENESDIPTNPGSDNTEDATEDPNGRLTVEKNTISSPANGSGYALGEEIKYEITVINDGNLTITDITVTDELTDDEWSIPSLAPGVMWSTGTSYIVTEADILVGEVVNVATAKGTSPDPDEPDVPVSPGTDPEPTDGPRSRLVVTKNTTSSPANGSRYVLGETITYAISVLNAGNTTIRNITLMDEVQGYDSVNITSNLDKTTLEPGETANATYSHVVTREDTIQGSVFNYATASAPSGPGVTPGITEDQVESSSPCEGSFNYAYFLEGSDEGVTVITSSQLYDSVADAGDNKCAWVCRDGYRLISGRCVEVDGDFEDLELYFLKSDGTINHSTIMDRNLGATAVYNQDYSSPNTASYGYYYQWGNNWGFRNEGDVPTSSTQVDASGYGPTNPLGYYSSSIFIKNNTAWDSSNNENLWGGESATITDKQGPCPVGYHIPTKNEWVNIYNTWNSTNIVANNKGIQWASDLLMPFAGYRDNDTSSSFNSQDTFGDYRSSTPYLLDYSRAHRLSLTSISINPHDFFPRAGGFSIRCFKNTTNTNNLTIHANGGTNAVIAVDGDIFTALGEPVKDGYTFEGWYRNSNFANQVHVGDVALTDLYAKWRGDQEFEDLELYFLKSNGSIEHETIMDRNMGATEVYNQNYDTPNTASYGKYYKWGNNQGFAADDAAFSSAEPGTWVVGDRGPCPEGYHVPSIGERTNMYSKRSDINTSSTNIGRGWTYDLLLPFAGYRNYIGNNLQNTSYGYYWSSWTSTPNTTYANYGYFDLPYIRWQSNLSHANGLSVRCFKNTDNAQTLTIHANGGTNAVIAVDGDRITSLGSPIKEGYDFEGWYSNPGFTTEVRVGYTAPTHLYAKWNGCDVDSTEIHDLELFFISNEGNISHYMMMDRNLGATEIYNKQGNDGQNASSNGCYFQWGNNHAFGMGAQTTSVQVDPTGYGPGNYYYGSEFYCYNQGGSVSTLYTQPFNYHMWGGGLWRESSNDWTSGSDGTDVDRKGPCPSGYHVPRGREMDNLLTNRRSAYSSSESRGDAFAAHLLMPYGRYIEVYCGQQNTTKKGGGVWLSDVYYTSSQNSIIQIYDDGPMLKSNGWAHGMPVRCVKNSFSSQSQRVIIHPDGGVGAVIAIDWTDDSSGIITTLGTPTKANSVFEGWYTEPTFINRVTESSTISNGAHLYAKWGCDIESTEVNDLEVFLISNEGNISHYMMMDRNLGATEAFNQDISSPNESSYGCYFQWGNNYPFNGGRNGSASTTSTLTDTENYGPGRLNGYYYNSTRYCVGGGGEGMYPYADRSGGVPLATRFWGGGWINTDGTTYTNGGGIDGTDIDRQGPCPAGYHIPRGKEMENIMNDWKVISDYNESDTEDINLEKSKIMASDLLLPFAGRNGESCGNENHYLGKGTFGKYLISDYYKFNNNHLHMGHTSDPDGIFLKGNGPAYGYSMRCVKNNISANQKVNIHPNGGTKAVITIDWTDDSNGIITTLGTPTKENSEFKGWYTDSTFTNGVTESSTISNGAHLYAKWASNTYLCGEGFGNAHLVPGSDQNLTQNTTSQLFDSIEEAGDTKCAWVCDIGYHRVGQACIQNPYQCEGGFLHATLVEGSDQNLTANTTSTLYATVVDAGNNKCAYVCIDGYRLTNGICVAENQIVKDLELYFLGSNGTINHTTLMDRNLGATEVYNQNYSSPNAASYGYYYQWGNNWGFDNQGSVTTSSEQVDASGYGPGNYYSSAVFIIGSQWDTSNNENLWGEVTNTFDARQGPCPSGYHVPSNTEWKGIYDDWNDANIVTSDIGRQWASDFLMPFVGYRSLSSSSVYSKGSFGNYWSSKAKSVSAAYSFTFDSLTLSPYNEGGIANGYSVRCFKNAANTQTLTIHANSGTNAVIAIDDGKITALGEPIREGHTFGGWHSDPGFLTTSRVHVGDTAPTHLYAKWAKNVYGCVGDFLHATLVEGSDQDLTANTDSQLFESVAAAGDTKCAYVCDSCYEKNGNSCSLKNYTITYDVDGGSPAISNDTVTCGGSTLLAIGPTKAGYTFIGWKSSVTNQVYSGGVRYTPTSNVTMTAQWIDCMNYITYYANGGTLANGTTNPTSVRCGNSTTLAAAPSRTCYTFTKWKNSANSQLYNAGASYSPSSNVVMSAQWNPKTYTLTYNCNGGNGNPGTQTGAYGDIGVLKNGGCEKANNTLVGWSLTQNGSSYVWGLGAQMSGDLMNTCTNKILYAIYQENPKCTITFNSNGGSTVAPQTIYCGSLGTKPANPTKNGATFAGWYSNSSLTSPYNWGSEVNNNIILYAKWNNCTRTINYVLNGGSMSAGEPNPATVQCGGSKILPEPSKACYTFRNWVGSGTNTYNAGTSFTPNTGSVTLTAKWDPQSFTLKYNCGNGEGNPGNDTMKYGVAGRTKSTGCTKTGYQLIGWSLTQNSSTATWGLGAKITLYSCDNPTTLYAVYVENNKCIITFESNGGSAVSSQIITCGTKGTKPANPTREGHTFGEWYRESSLSNLYDWTGVVNNNITLYAKWTTRQYTATIRATPTGYGTVNGSSQATVTKNYDTPITIDGNKVTIGEGSDKVEVTATPKSPSGGYIYRFDDWTNNCGETLTSNCTITANFSQHVSSATFTEGYNFNRIIKTLAKGSPANTDDADVNIKYIVKSSSMPNGVSAEIVSSEDSILPIYAWYNGGTIYYYTEATNIYLNPDSSRMFAYCGSLIDVDVGIWNTSNVTNMNHMFAYCGSLRDLDVGGWDTSNVTDMYYMFISCTSLTVLSSSYDFDVSNWDTKNVTNMGGMFADTGLFGELDLSSWDTSNVTSMSYMFAHSAGLTKIKFGNTWNTANVTYMEGMFEYCTDLEEINVSKNGDRWNTENVVSMYRMFAGCINLKELDVSNWDTKNVIDMSFMFDNCRDLEALDVSRRNTAKVTRTSFMFSDCSSLESLNLSSWNTANVTNMQYMFHGCKKLTSLNLNNWNTANVTNMKGVFGQCIKLTSLNLNNWNTENVTDMNGMFFMCESLTSLNLSNWNTTNVTDMGDIFAQCKNLQGITFGINWNTENVTDMEGMFFHCEKLTSLNVSNWNTTKVTDMHWMFDDCKTLETLDLAGWNTENVTDMNSMFFMGDNLKSITFGSNWNTTNVTNMESMFRACPELTILDLTNFNTNNVTDMSNMFSLDLKLKTVKVSNNFVTTRVTNSESMFAICSSLEGGNGTQYNLSNPDDKTYARIDRPGIPGYFTAP